MFSENEVNFAVRFGPNRAFYTVCLSAPPDITVNYGHFTVSFGHVWAQRGQNTVRFEAHMSKTSSFTVLFGPSGPFWAILGSKRGFLGVKLANFGPKSTVKYGIF